MKLEGHQTRLTVRTRRPPRSCYGASNHIHNNRFLSRSDDLPVAVISVGTDDRTAAFGADLDELITGGPVIIDDAEMVNYVGRPARTEP